MANIQVQQENPVQKLKKTLNADSVQQQFKNALKENAALFIASLIDLYANDKYLQQCDPNAVIMEALKAATLKLPINKSLGFAYIVPYKNSKAQNYTPTMIIGYKGYLQMAQRTAQYRYINADCVFEGEQIDQDRLTGEIYISGEPTSEKAVGYFAHIETINGFKKTVFWSKSKVVDHAKRYSQSYASDYSPWKKQFDTMAIKTVLRHLLSRYGIMSVDMAQAVDIDSGDYKEPEAEKIDRPSISYAATAKPPPASYPMPEKKPHLVMSQPEKVEVNYEGDDPISMDEFGTPADSPFEKSKWFHLRAGSIKDGTGFGAYVQQNARQIPDASETTYRTMGEKYQKLYGRPMPYGRDGLIVAQSDQAPPADPPPGEAPPENIEPLLDAPPAEDAQNEVMGGAYGKLLRQLEAEHKREFIMITKGQAPADFDQALDWVNQINELVIEHQKNPPSDDQGAEDKF